MTRLLVRHHGDEFSSSMDKFLPNWKLSRQKPDAAPLAHADWRA
jgi:hypothetical protein